MGIDISKPVVYFEPFGRCRVYIQKPRNTFDDGRIGRKILVNWKSAGKRICSVGKYKIADMVVKTVGLYAYIFTIIPVSKINLIAL